MNPAIRRIVLGAALLFAATPAAAQQPRVTNAQFQARPAPQGIEREFRSILATQSAPAWVAYAVPMIAGERQMCCSNDGSYSSWRNCCRLEKNDGVSIHNDDSGTSGSPIQLEGPQRMLVLWRVEQKRVGRILTVSEDCELDAGGLPFLWLGNARGAESVALLSEYVRPEESDTREEKKLRDRAIFTMAYHADPAADRALENFVAPSQPESLREQTAFWLGVARGRSGYQLLQKMARQDRSERVREKVAFALSQSREPEAVDEMIHMARNDASSRVRGQALFWLAQKAGKKAENAITSAIENDPETDVKKKAVFALSQLPKQEGVPLLIQVARTNRNPAVRKQAMFWLGQSNDARAVAFFEEVLR